MTPLTQIDRKAGRIAMEDSMSPLQKALRRFTSGRPPITPKNSPIAAVTLATEQRARLARILTATKELDGAEVGGVAVVARASRGTGPEPPTGLADTWPVIEGKEGEAIASLQQYAAHDLEFRIIGLMFTVRHDGKTYPVSWLIERTQEATAALEASHNRQMARTVARPD